MPLIELSDISKTYDLGEVQVHALVAVDLRMGDGEYLALIGASGSGKSTLMNTLGCLDRPTRGQYKLGEYDVISMTPKGRARLRNQKIGFVFQNFSLLARTTALENVELPLLYRRAMSMRERRRRALEMLDRVGLSDRVNHHPGQLSGGQQQRVAIARALVNEPSILLADEPTGNLDSRTSREIIQIFRRLNEQHGLSIVLVTHDLEVARNADRSVVLADGRVIADTTDFEQARQSLQAAAQLPPEDPEPEFDSAEEPSSPADP